MTPTIQIHEESFGFLLEILDKDDIITVRDDVFYESLYLALKHVQRESTARGHGEEWIADFLASDDAGRRRAIGHHTKRGCKFKRRVPRVRRTIGKKRRRK